MRREGFLEICNPEVIRGWAYNLDRPNEIEYLDIYIRNELVITIPANMFREDLLNHGKGNGFHAFEYVLNEFKNIDLSLVSVRFAGTQIDLTGIPQYLCEPITQRRIQIASEFLEGVGIEVGALHNPLPIKHLKKVEQVLYVDRMSVDDLRKQYPELQEHNLVEVDIIDDGEKLTTIKNESLDFIICNHMLEHCENPIGTIRNYIQKLKQGGAIFLSVPDKRFSFDIDRDLTTFKHCLQDDIKGPQISRNKHFEEWARYINKLGNAEIPEQVRKLIEVNYSIHFHVWDIDSFTDFLIETKKYLNDLFMIKQVERNDTEVLAILIKS